LAGLPSLARDVELAGVQVTLEVDGDLDELPEALQATIFRIVQESLTNTLKHAPGADRSRIRVVVEEERVTLELRDNGGGRTGVDADGTGPTAGNGIRGMTERADLYGGQLDAGADTGGWLVTCVLARTETARA
jgi:signal transduction histidine kinase